MAKYKIIPSSRTIVHSPISIGHKAEKGVEAIEFDLTAWVETYGSGTLTVIMRRWGDAIPYPIALEIDENNKATWVLSDTDTARAGIAYAQLSYIVGETVVKKSDIYTFRVMDSLTGEGDPPEAYESWLEHLTHIAAEAMAEVLDIESIVTDKTLTVDGGIADAKATGDALALKADKSTTYTKTEVDTLIDEVEVETDTTLEIAGAPADAKKVGDELSDIKADLGAYASLSTSKRTTIPNNTNLNDLTTPGQYKVGNVSKAKTISNIPKQMAGILDVSTGTSESQVIQKYTVVATTNAPYSYIRSKTSSGWTEWARIIDSDVFSKVMKITGGDYTTIESNTDLNTITTPGAYKVTTASIAGTLTNSPLSTIGFTLRVINLIDSATICQLAIEAAATLITYIRYGKITTNEWGEWKKVLLDFNEETLVAAINTMGSAVSSNTQRIEDIEDSLGISTEYFTPYTTQEQDLYDKVNNDIDKNTLVFLVSTDNHYRETTDSGSHQVEFAQVMAKIAKRLRVDAIINLGDIITQYVDSVDDAVYENEDVTAEEINTRRLAKMATAFQSTGVPFLYTLAHHEMSLHDNGPTSTDNTTQTSVYPYPESKVLGLCGKGAEWLEEHHYSQDPLSAGYYVDFSRHKIRLISIDSVSYSATGFTPSSIAFITESFSNVPTGYKVIVCTHVATREPGVYAATIKNWQQVETIMGNFVSNGGTILAVLHGHSHYDNVVFIENVPYPYICICCAENSWSTVGEKIEAGVQGNPVSYKYHAARYGALGTYNEYLFDIMCVHPDRDTINFFRFGIGEDRTVTLPTE